MKTKVSFRMMGLLMGCVMMMNSCKKPNDVPGARPVPAQPGAQEQMLLGKWILRCAETYEVSGADSAGNLMLNLVAVENYDAGCKIEFESAFDPGNQYRRAAGNFAGCDSTATFAWRIKQPSSLDLSTGTQYSIDQLAPDSAAFSVIYLKDILKLKTVYRYRRG